LPPKTRPVAGLLTQRVADLPLECLDLLDTASCVGSQFELSTLAFVHENEPSTLAPAPSPAVQAGLIVPLDTKTFHAT
jgi:predicted ATPase